MSGKLVIVGDSLFAEIAYEYFTHDSPYEVVAFAVEAEYRKRDEFFGLPVVDFETLEETHPAAEHSVYVAMVYSQLNRLRARLAKTAKERGYALASYVSSRAFVWRNVQLGEHVFIFEDNTLQPFVTVGDNVVLWSGNHIGHHSTIRDNVFIASHVVISGSVVVGENTFLGVNATLVNDIEIGADSWIGPDVSLTRSIPPASVYRPPRSEKRDVTSYKLLDVPAPVEDSGSS
ncbi:acetyltransferase [Solirubrobacter taibaiensis]|nr:acetyltransferase [Solirubrobacter taibaiensis]